MSRNMPTIIDKTGPEMLIDYYKAIEDSSAKMLRGCGFGHYAVFLQH